MVDNMNPTSQFHPYQPVDVVPVSERPESGLRSILGKLGITPNRAKWNDALGKARAYAKSNPAMVLGGLAAVAIVAGLMRRRT
jgi:hypothetical protein